MKSSTRIRFDFQNASRQADRLDELAGSLEQQVIRQLADTEQQLRTAWTGDSARRFTAKQAELQDKISHTARTLREIADEIRRIARRVYDTEMEALRIASQQGHSGFSSGGGEGGGFSSGGGFGGGGGGGGFR